MWLLPGRLFDIFGDEAVHRGIAIVPACGFDYAIEDSLAWLAARDHEPAAGGGCRFRSNWIAARSNFQRPLGAAGCPGTDLVK